MNLLQGLPVYKSHKLVQAMKIKAIEQAPADRVFVGGSWRLVSDNDVYQYVEVNHAFVLKHEPKVGGYYVLYEDGYQSFSPAEAFEGGYTAVNQGIDPPTEAEIALVASKAPRVTPKEIEAEIAGEFFLGTDPYVNQVDHFINDGFAPDAVKRSMSCLTICVLVLRNGFTVTGESACASPANFDAEIGHRIARASAIEKIWPLLGFRLRDQLAAEANGAGRDSQLPPHQQRVIDEHAELDGRITRLGAFIESDKCKSLGESEQFDLITQYSHMCSYRKVLKNRIERFAAVDDANANQATDA